MLMKWLQLLTCGAEGSCIPAHNSIKAISKVLSTACILFLSMLLGTKQWKGHANMKVRLGNEFPSFNCKRTGFILPTLALYWPCSFDEALTWLCVTVSCEVRETCWGSWSCCGVRETCQGSWSCCGVRAELVRNTPSSFQECFGRVGGCFSEGSSASQPRDLHLNLTHTSNCLSLR